MSNVIPLNNYPSRCNDCLYTSDCPLITENGGVSSVANKTRVRVLHAGDHLYRAGERLESMYRLRSGNLKTIITRSDGSEQVTGFYGPGEWLGVDAVEQESHPGDAVALDTVSVCVIPLQPVIQHCAKSSYAIRTLMAILSRRLIANERLHMSLACDTASQRLAQFLLILSNNRAAVNLDGSDLSLSMSRLDIASYLALAVETVSRLLTRMQKIGVIRVHRTRIEILDRDGLLELAGNDINLNPLPKLIVCRVN